MVMSECIWVSGCGCLSVNAGEARVTDCYTGVTPRYLGSCSQASHTAAAATSSWPPPQRHLVAPGLCSSDVIWPGDLETSLQPESSHRLARISGLIQPLADLQGSLAGLGA